MKLVGDVRGRGLMIGVEIVKDKAPRSTATPNATALSNWRSSAACCSWAAGRARCASAPPLVVTKEEADVAVDVLEECIAAVGKNA